MKCSNERQFENAIIHQKSIKIQEQPTMKTFTNQFTIIIISARRDQDFRGANEGPTRNMYSEACDHRSLL